MIKLKVENGKVGHGISFERLRRVSGYLAPTARFTLAKQAEVGDRVKHDTGARIASVEGKLLLTYTDTCTGDERALSKCKFQ